MREANGFFSEQTMSLARRPLMHAYTREAYVVQLSLLCQLSGNVEAGRQLHSELFGVAGTNHAAGMELPLDEEFANRAMKLFSRKLSNELPYLDKIG